MITTDLAARGLDTTQVKHGASGLCGSSFFLLLIKVSLVVTVTCMQVSHVINFDFPDSTVDFLHRSGRAGRIGTEVRGRCTSFVVHRRDQRFVNIIKVSCSYSCCFATVCLCFSVRLFQALQRLVDQMLSLNTCLVISF